MSTVSSWTTELGVTERRQQEHYDSIAADYEAHYSDEWSAEYRKRFIYDPMFAGLNLEGHERARRNVRQRSDN
jgi:hypothetical protein